MTSKALLVSVFVALAASVCASVNLNTDAAGGLREAQVESSKGQKLKALSMLESQLMDSGATVGLETQDWDHSDAVRQGIRIWSDALGSENPFKFSTSAKRPDILVKFVTTLQSEGDIQGKVDIDRQFFWGGHAHGYHVVSTVYVCDTTEGGRPLSEAEVREVVAHELGHVLGLDDNPQTQGLMGPFVPGEPRTTASDDEINTVLNYRADLRDAIQRVESALTG